MVITYHDCFIFAERSVTERIIIMKTRCVSPTVHKKTPLGGRKTDRGVYHLYCLSFFLPPPNPGFWENVSPHLLEGPWCGSSVEHLAKVNRAKRLPVTERAFCSTGLAVGKRAWVGIIMQKRAAAVVGVASPHGRASLSIRKDFPGPSMNENPGYLYTPVDQYKFTSSAG